MHLYEDVSMEDTLNFTEEAQNCFNLQWGEQGLENQMLPLVVKKALA
jgi:hypothetical protein